MKDCPKNNKSGNSGMQGQQQQGTVGCLHLKPRDYALTGEESAEPTQAVEDKILIQNFICKALFYLGATHSFLSIDCAKRLDLLSENM